MLHGRGISPPDRANFAGILVCMARKFNAVWREKTRLGAFEVVNTGSKCGDRHTGAAEPLVKGFALAAQDVCLAVVIIVSGSPRRQSYAGAQWRGGDLLLVSLVGGVLLPKPPHPGAIQVRTSGSWECQNRRWSPDNTAAIFEFLVRIATLPSAPWQSSYSRPRCPRR